jgi:uncharacterized protein (TIGR03086 family)
MNEKEVFILADEALSNVVQQIKDDQWEMEMPPDFRTNTPGKATLRDIINYHAYDDAWVPDILSGQTMEQAGKDKFDGDLLGDDPKGNFAKLVQAATAAVRELDDLDEVVHLSYGEFTAQEYLQHITYFRGSRVYDLAKVIGVSTNMPDDLVQGMWDILSPHADEWRQMGVFGPEVEVPEDVDMQTKLLALTGRKI